MHFRNGINTLVYFAFNERYRIREMTLVSCSIISILFFLLFYFIFYLYFVFLICFFLFVLSICLIYNVLKMVIPRFITPSLFPFIICFLYTQGVITDNVQYAYISYIFMSLKFYSIIKLLNYIEIKIYKYLSFVSSYVNLK